MTTTAMRDKGDAYVAAWPTVISAKLGLSCEYTAVAMRRAGIVDKATEQRLRRAFLRDEVTPEVGDLTPGTAYAVIGELRAIRAEISARSGTHCPTCGLPLRHGECSECV